LTFSTSPDGIGGSKVSIQSEESVLTNGTSERAELDEEGSNIKFDGIARNLGLSGGCTRIEVD